MNSHRIEAVAEALAGLGYDGIAAFDRTEPVFTTIESLYDAYDSGTYVKLLVLLARTQDYQLSGAEQRFWQELTRVSLRHGSLESEMDVKQILGTFMEADVNARLNQQKRKRLIRTFDAGFPAWFTANQDDVSGYSIWEELADALNLRPEAKTVVLAMKTYDIAHFVKHGEYREFPRDIPIPCDLQVKRVSRTSGITSSDKTEDVLSAWAVVLALVSERLGRPVSLLRIDSSIWQAGQIIGRHESDPQAAERALIDNFLRVGIDSDPAESLAAELTVTMH